MAPVTSFLAAALLASAAFAKPVAPRSKGKTVSFAKKIHTENLVGLADRDRARALHLINQANGILARDDSAPVTNQAVSYIATLSVGSPSTDFQLIVDTGSSNTWVGASTQYTPTETSQDTGSTVQVSYGSGSFSGEEFLDQVALSDDLVVQQQSIGVASQSQGFTGVDGILGIGPVDLTQGTTSDGNEVPTITDNLFSAGTIDNDLVAVGFAPAETGDDLNGELTFGDTDSSKFEGEITFVPITSTSPASQYWGIDAKATYNSKSIVTSTAGIVDTGTTLVLLATNFFKKYQSATGATADKSTGLLTVSSSVASKLKPLSFVIGGTTFSLTANAQIWPRALNSQIGGTSGKIYLITADLGQESGQGLDFILGQSFLERFYSVFDTGNSQVGLATTSFTGATSN